MINYDLEIYKGQTFTLSLTLRDDNGSVLNLGSNRVSGYLKTKFSDTNKLVDLNATVFDAANGIVTLYIPATGTEALPVNYAFYDVEMFNPIDGAVTKILAGKAQIFPEITF